LIALGAIVFTPVNPDSNGIFGFIQISGVAERVLNLFLLIPLAIFTRICYSQLSFKAIFIICICSSAVIEIIQIAIPGRVSDLVDVFTNSFGALCALIGLKRLMGQSSVQGRYLGQ
jgi:glycopeptide antibiotics resistance protein